ncbi:MAG: Hsp70 family protein [Lewinellaceae bacterium]|nr:Hsp70 family protein [Lewinellaceae bacterium]
MGKIIGIDLGMTHSCMAVSVMKGHRVAVIPSAEGQITMPTTITLLEDGEIRIGDPAETPSSPGRTIPSFMRLIGARYSDIEKEVEKLPYKVVKSDSDALRISIDGHLFSPQELLAMFLKKMKKDAEEYLKEEISEAIIAGPALFNQSQRQAILEAGEIAGLKIKRVLSKSSCSVLTLGLEQKITGDKTAAVIALDGEDFEVSVQNIGDGVFEVISIYGDYQLNEIGSDQIIADWLIELFLEQEGIDLRKDPAAFKRLADAAEKAKGELATSPETEINLPYIASENGKPKHLIVKLSQAELAQQVNLKQKVIASCKKILNDISFSGNKVDEILVVGFSKHRPEIEEAMEGFFGIKINRQISPEAAAALGAAVIGGVIMGEIQDILFLDVTPHTYGIEAMGGVLGELIKSNETFPTKRSTAFSTAEKNQKSVEIHVLQGNSRNIRDNLSLGKFQMDGIPRAPAGEPRIEVTFDLDANGALTILSKIQGSQNERSWNAHPYTGLSLPEIEDLKRKAAHWQFTGPEKKAEEENTGNEKTIIEDVPEKAIIKEEDKTVKKGIDLPQTAQAFLKKPKGRSWFLGIGISNYKEFPVLSNAVKDVEDVLSLLTSKYDVQADLATLLFNEKATREGIINQFDRLVENIEKDDKLIIYYSGHGHLDKNDRGYWIPYDASRGSTANYVRNATILDFINDIKSLHTLLIVDSCFSGSLIMKNSSRSAFSMDEREVLPSRCALCSGRHDQEVFDGVPGKNSPFAESILDILGRNEHTKINFSKIVDRVIEQTRRNYNQLPWGKSLYNVGDKGGEYFFYLKQDEQGDWESSRQEGTLAAFNHFLARYPESRFAKEASQELDRLKEEEAWKQAKTSNTIFSYFEFEKKFPKGRYALEALDAIDKLEEEEAWQDAVRLNKLSSYRKYTSEYPDGAHSAQAESRISEIIEVQKELHFWKSALETNSIKSYKDYLDQYPKGKYTIEAINAIRELEKEVK